ncbi:MULTISPECIES: ABC transporter ATP-binding protein [Rhizobium/Agrobacterium group]|uniref:iron ABC transporter ATP-binding protein n=1 Tax=Rhizobium/Agrobacterium group TaxID=227290 RepID=UPI0003F2192B|nr:MULTISPECIES: ATP-binding cassette domain-containing protein [Rhizobium/Agrobacterium group]AHK04906.1 iron compound ABC transporter, ATP-binding protein [Agrobacterium tumefaciens LBA4213 (Ach5)]AKC10634.1 iron ABC transporter ATP-binding protein [Agrobacterium tumefaciens]AYM20017.1 hypothetical protein At15955_50320 [Agrobacterium tumefaciens]AYM71320.1 hypothetical protein AtA6_51040 [Agrobacterium tumefaciens]NIB59709.1 ATP-binding cassette domain-containing protein [Agrobacterium tume
MIETHALTKRYGTVTVLDNVCVNIPKGGLTSIIGPNGAGKSTLLSLISRLEPMTSGSVSVDGLDVSNVSSNVLARRLSILRQDNQVAIRLTVRDLVAFGRFPYSGGRLTSDDRGHIDRALEYLDITAMAERFLDELSGGQRQRAFLATVLCQDTDYVLLDEPLNSLDLKHAAATMRLLRRATDELGKTMVLVLHDINFASLYSDHIIAMRAGSVVVQGHPDAIVRQEVLQPIFDIALGVHELNARRIVTYYE